MCYVKQQLWANCQEVGHTPSCYRAEAFKAPILHLEKSVWFFLYSDLFADAALNVSTNSSNTSTNCLSNFMSLYLMWQEVRLKICRYERIKQPGDDERFDRRRCIKRGSSLLTRYKLSGLCLNKFKRLLEIDRHVPTHPAGYKRVPESCSVTLCVTLFSCLCELVQWGG